jgi:hypothetical protein
VAHAVHVGVGDRRREQCQQLRYPEATDDRIVKRLADFRTDAGAQQLINGTPPSGAHIVLWEWAASAGGTPLMPDSYRSIWSRHRFSRLTKPPISASSEKYCRRIGPRLLRRPDTMAAIATWKMIAFPGAHYGYRDWVDDTTSAIPALMDGMHSPQRNRDTDADRRVRRWRHICQRTILSSSARPEPLDHRRISPRELDPSRAARRGLHLGVERLAPAALQCCTA